MVGREVGGEHRVDESGAIVVKAFSQRGVARQQQVDHGLRLRADLFFILLSTEALAKIDLRRPARPPAKVTFHLEVRASVAVYHCHMHNQRRRERHTRQHPLVQLVLEALAV